MPWQQVSPGRYEREFDSLEHFYRQIAAAGAPLQREHYFISSVIQLKEQLSETELRHAWKALRFQYPQMAAVADDSGTRFIYIVPSSEEIETWMKETFIVDPRSRSARSLYSSLKPSTQFKLYYLPLSRQLLFRTPHWRIDGIGLELLQNVFLHILVDGSSEIAFDDSEATRLAHSLDDAASVPQKTTPQISQAAEEEVSIFQPGPPSISIATLPNVTPTSPQLYHTEYSTGITERIIASCREQAITVTTAAHAALIRSTQQYAQHNFDPTTRGSGGGRYCAFTALDLRKYLPAPWNGPNAAVSLYHTGLPLSIDLDVHRDFASIAEILKSTYGRDLAKDEPRNMFNFLAEYVRKALIAFLTPPLDPLMAPAYPALGSLGIVDKYVQKKYQGTAAAIEIEDWWLGVEIIDRTLFTHVWAWDGGRPTAFGGQLQRGIL
jgi:hypothetical protein